MKPLLSFNVSFGKCEKTNRFWNSGLGKLTSYLKGRLNNSDTPANVCLLFLNHPSEKPARYPPPGKSPGQPDEGSLQCLSLQCNTGETHEQTVSVWPRSIQLLSVSRDSDVSPVVSHRWWWPCGRSLSVPQPKNAPRSVQAFWERWGNECHPWGVWESVLIYMDIMERKYLDW